MSATTIVPMHGLGGGADLPIPASLAIAGGTAALTLSFVVLLLAWKTPRFGDGSGQRPVPQRLATLLDSPAWTVGLRTVGLAFFCFMLWPALFGPDTLNNPTFGVIYVLLWVGLVPLSLLFGRFYRAINPARTIHVLLVAGAGRSPSEGLRSYPTWLGYWPSALTLLAFVWLELVSPNATYLGTIVVWFAGYLAVMLFGAAIYGDRWFERADPFEVYSTLLAHLSLWGRDRDGHLVWVSPLRHLARIPAGPGLVAVVAVLLGSTAWDSWRESGTWIRFVQTANVDAITLNTVGLFVAITGVALTFAAASMATRTDRNRWELPQLLSHSVVPIIVGYMIAHYLSYLVQVGQLTLIQLSDPVGTGLNLFGTADWEVSYWLALHPTLLASIKVVAIVTGHVLGVIAAHDRALGILPKRHQITGQLALLFAMVLYTYMGLYLLFGS